MVKLLRRIINLFKKRKMAKINFLTAYPLATTPLSGNSILIGSLASGGDTKNFLLSDISAYVMSANTLTLQDVCDNGSVTTTGITVAGTTTLNGTVDINNTADISGNTTIGGTLGVTGVSTLGEIDASGVADIADTLTLSKASGTALSVSAGSVYFASDLDVFGLHHQWGALTVEGITTLNNALDANSTADIADTLTLSKPTGTGLQVTSNANILGNLTVDDISSQIGNPFTISAGGSLAATVNTFARYTFEYGITTTSGVISNGEEIMLWKEFKDMPISIEYNINF
jgi:predicted ThiF/HesA family dinucleotide-utilizing enzyme